MGTGRAIPGTGEYYPAAKQARRTATAGSGPRLAGVVLKQGLRPLGVPGVRRRGRLQVPPLRGPVGPMLGPPCTWTLANAASGPIRARVRAIS